MGKRAALYLRVSTTRQADKDLSIPDQRRQLDAYCAAKGWDAVAEFAEPGASATDDKRPAFQKMIEEACSPDRPFDVVLVHSLSRFFRDAYAFEHYRRRLEKHGIEVVSVTQDFGDDPSAVMVRQILNVFDEYQSRENAKHVIRAMKENARQGFWNGALPPYGYRTVPVEVRGGAVKKKLAIEPSEAETVRQIYDLYGQGQGIRAIASILNGKGVRFRRGGNFNSSHVHQILTRTTDKGVHHFNKHVAKTGQPKDPSEWVLLETPIIIEPELFDAIQDRLMQRRPANTPPRIVNGPTLLTGIAKCGTCGGGMTLRTGKGGRYRYYACNTRMTQGKSACEGRNVPMGRLDTLVLEALEEKVFAPDRVKVILSALAERYAEVSKGSQEDEKRLRAELRKTEEKIDRLYDAVADGHIKDGDGLRRNLAKHEQRREELLRQVSSKKRVRQVPGDLLSQANIEKFVATARRRLRDPKSDLRKKYVGLFVDRVEVRDGEVRISGSKEALAAAMQAKASGSGQVPSYVGEWWARQDSNLQPDGYEPSALTS